MPDLSVKAAHQYWKQFPDPIIHRVLTFMESVETHPHVGNALFDAILNELGKALDDIEKVDLATLNQQDTFIQLGNHLKMTQTLRLLQALDTAQPGAAARLLMYAEMTTRDPQDDAGLFLQRNLVFERLRLLSRLFSEDRLKLVKEALEDEA
jgi:intracellular multiplication protein IcmW